MNVDQKIYEKFPDYIKKSKRVYISKFGLIIISNLRKRKMYFVKYWYDEKEDIIRFNKSLKFFLEK